MDNTEIFNKIVSGENISKAYLNLAEKLDTNLKTKRFKGIDSIKFDDFECVSEKVLEAVKDEIIRLKPLSPAIMHEIPKKNGGFRKIFIYSIKDRIKAQAVSQILEPVFESIYSPFLFSYRKNRSNYYAARSVARRYNKNFKNDKILVTDIKQYTDFIDHDLLIQKLKQIGFGNELLELLKLFINNSYFNEKELNRDYGLIQGVPLIAFFANLYLNDLDFYIGKRVQLYRRVGDDLIVIDPSKEKMMSVINYIIEYSNNHNLQISLKSITGINEKYISRNENHKFEFLGYRFENGLISIRESSVNKKYIKWKKKLAYSSFSEKAKFEKLKWLISKSNDNLNTEFLQIVRQYPLVTDYGQIQNLSLKFYKLITKFFYGKYSHRNHNKVHIKLKNFKIPSLYKYFIDIKNGRKKFSNLSL